MLKMTYGTAIILMLSACALHPPAEPASAPESLVVTSGGVNRSATYLARVDGGVLVIDLGWWGATDALGEGLARLGATTDEVVAVFLTHSHRDHMGAWRSVRHAPFHVAAQELDLLHGRREHGGWIPRWAERVMESDLPAPDEVTVHTFDSDTFFTFGSDTIRAFLVAGHTAGSAAYLFRGTLYAGDAISRTWTGGFGPARTGYSEDTRAARRSLKSLRQRLEAYDVHTMCTAHRQCSAVTDAFWSDLLGDGAGDG